MNILKLQDGLKNLSDEQLAQEMRLPSGSTPQYLIMTEMQRREKMRAEFSGSEPPKTTMAEEMSGEASPPQGGMPPDDGQDANAQGLMGMPDETMAGNAMRARISGQPQQIDGMTALPPQAMAVGGAVQFGNPFAGAQMGSAPSSTGYAPIQRYTYTAPPPPPAPDYTSMLRGLGFNPRGVQGSVRPAKPPVVQKPPVSTAVPVRGRPAQNRGPIRRASDGGPIYMGSGGIFDDYNEATPEEVYSTMRDSDITDMLGKKPEELNTTFGAFGGNPVTLTREGLLAEAKRRNQMNPLERGVKDIGRFAFPFVDTVTGAAAYVPSSFAKANEGLYNRAKNYAFGDVPIPEDAYGMTERGNSSLPTKPGTASPGATTTTGAVAPQKKTAPTSAPVSGAAKKEEKPASDGGLAALLQQRQDRAKAYEDRANALLDKQRGDKDELSNRDFNAALMQLGLGLAGSKSNSLMGGIAEAGLPALQQYTAAREGRRKDEGALTDAELAILGKSNEIGQAEDKAMQDAYDAQRKYEIDQRTLDLQESRDADDARYQDAMASRGGSRDPYLLSQIKDAQKIIQQARSKDPAERRQVTPEMLRQAQAFLANNGSSEDNGGGLVLSVDATGSSVR